MSPDGGDDEQRRRRLLELVDGPIPSPNATNGASLGVAGAVGQSSLCDRLQRLCVVTASEVGVDGAGITVMGGTEAGLAGHRDQLAATGALTRRLEDLQLTAGEGPCLDAYAAGAPVLAGDVAAETTRWLGFGPEALAAGAAALFSLPLQVGAIRLGTLDLNRVSAGSLSRGQLADALALAVLATETLLELADPARQNSARQNSARRDHARHGPHAPRPRNPEAPGGLPGGWLPDVHADVHVASGMVSAQAGIDVATALIRVRAHAFASGEAIHDVARHIIDRELVLDDPGSELADPHDNGPPAPGPENDP